MLDGASLASHSSHQVGRHSSVLSHHKDLIVAVLGGHVLRDLSYLHLTLLLLIDVCCEDRGSLPQSVRQWWGQRECLH